MTMLRSRIGEIKSRKEWEQEVEEFWSWASLQDRYICNSRSKINRRSFKMPEDAFQRYAKIIGLEEIREESEPGYDGVFIA